MPTYEYVCPEGHAFEKFQKMTEKPRAKCPSCGKMASRRISGGAGLVFKGSGFYITDYGKDGKGARRPESADAPASEAKTDKGGTKPEAKPASGSESSSASKPEKPPAKKAKE